MSNMTGPYFVCLKRHITSRMLDGHGKHPTRWLFRYLTAEAAMAQMRHLGSFFQSVCVWDSRVGKMVAVIDQITPLQKSKLGDGIFDEIQKIKAERPEGKIETIRKVTIYADTHIERKPIGTASPKG